MSDPPSSGRIEINGVVRSFSFRATDGDFAVVRLEIAGQTELATAVGALGAVSAGETLRVQGQWVDDPRFGRQLRVDGWLPAAPETKDGLEKYLASGVVDGIGPELAHRLVQQFGLDTLDVLDHHPERLTEVEGIGPLRAKKVIAAWADKRDARALMVLLRGYGIGAALTGRISRTFGNRALEVCRQDPYRLALEVPGVGFASADQIARSQGLRPEHPTRIAAGAHHLLAEATDQGHVCRPIEELAESTARSLGSSPEDVISALSSLETEGRIISDQGPTGGPLVYLPKLYRAETAAAGLLRQRIQTPPPRLKVNVDRVIAEHEAKAGIQLAGAQRTAVKESIEHSVLVITGGPGTGKTTLVRAILAVYARAKTKVLLAAPTGRAAKRLEEATGKKASTLHRLLEVNPQTGAFERSSSAPLEADALIIDEVSMVDLPLFSSVLEALPPEARLILVGDADQLPSVGPGRVLADLLEAGLPSVRLTSVFRQAESSLIVRNAYRIHRGEPLERPPPEKDKLFDFYLIERSQPQAAIQTVLTLVGERIPERFGFNPVDDIQVLTPIHRGPIGSRALNEALQQRLNPGSGGIERSGQRFRVGDKVMQTKNDYDLGVLNGELGRVERVDERNKKLAVRFDNDLIRYEPKALEHLSLAYACSVHKAQGSEYPAVVIVLGRQHAIMLDRQLLYTAVTRAKRLLILVADRAALDLAARPPRNGRRGSALSDRLTDPRAWSGRPLAPLANS